MALNYKKRSVNDIEPKETAPTAFNRKKSDVNCVEPEKKQI